MTRIARRFATAVLGASLMTSLAPAAPTRAEGPVETQAVEMAASVDGSRTFALSMPASHVAVHWPGAPDAEVSVALSVDGVTFGPDVAVELDEVGRERGDGHTYGTLMVADGATAVRLTSDRPLPAAELLVLDTRRESAGAWGLGATAAATVTQTPVITRAGWGADESLRFDAEGEEIWEREYFPIQKLVVHHTAMGDNDPDPAATVRGIYYYHAVTQGWGDIGYNFLIDSAGRVYEGRYSRDYAPGATPTGDDGTGRGVVAGHTRAYNAGSVGVGLLGTFDTRGPTPATRDALVRVLAWASARYGLDPLGEGLYVNPINGATFHTNTIAGHRDYSPTACPGAVLYAMLPDIRQRVANLLIAETFGDIGGSDFIGEIAWLQHWGISNGCAFWSFCPYLVVNREQMASFLSRALHLPPPTRDYFWDDNGSIHEADINRVADAGITLGCTESGGEYCPRAPVSRAAMASFLARALDLPDSTTNHFSDDDGSIHEADINRVADARITLGCAAGQYCPGWSTTREQMAAFLRRGLIR